MSHPDCVPGEQPLWAITGSRSSWSDLQAGDMDAEWVPDGQLATLSLDSDLGDPSCGDQAPAGIPVQQPPPGGTPSLDSNSNTCSEHGQELSLFCYQEYRLICPLCKAQGTCQPHRTRPAEERAAQIRNKIVDQCEKLQLQTAGIEKYLADALPAKIPRVASTARAARELVIQRLNFIRNLCENEEQRLLEEVHTEEERVQQGILTQTAHWTESARKLSAIRNYLVDALTERDDLHLINSETEMDERAEEAEGILEPQESDKLNFNMNCVQSPLLNRLWATSYLCCTTACENLTFDEKTMSPLLALAENNSLKFTHKKAKTYPDGPERFDHWPNCLASESYDKGVHMWKVNVGKTCAYKLGVTYRSIARKGSGNEARLGYNAVSWIFSRYDKEFRFSHDSQHQSVELFKGPKHICILADVDAGELIFFDPDSCVILYSHQTKFTAPICPVFAVADESISLENDPGTKI